MTKPNPPGRTDRRRFLQALAVLGIGGRTLLRSGDARAAVYATRSAAGRNVIWPDLGRRRLGRTGFEGSRLVFGCGAALSRGPKDDLLEAALDAGINVFDNGSAATTGTPKSISPPSSSAIDDSATRSSSSRRR